MATVTIILTDRPDGGCQIDAKSDPPINAAKELTAAQQNAVSCLKAMAAETACRRLEAGYEAKGGE